MFAPLVKKLPIRPSQEDAIVQAFSRMASLPNCIALDSSAHPSTADGQSLGRYSFFAADPVRWFSIESAIAGAFDELRSRLTMPRTQPLEHIGSFQGGWAGLMSYDFNRCLEPIESPRFGPLALPVAAWGLYDVVLVVDHQADTMHLVSQGFGRDPSDDDDDAARARRAAERLEFFEARLTDYPPDDSNSGFRNSAVSHGMTTAGANRIATHDSSRRMGSLATVPANNQTNRSPNTASVAPTTSRSDPAERELLSRLYSSEVHPGLYSCLDREQYLAVVRKAIDYIRAGDVFQVNLAQHLFARATTDSATLYRQLRSANPAPFGGYLDLGTAQIISSSPERLIRIDQGIIESRPIKGTRPRTGRPEVDLNVAAELMASAKDRAENIMIVDLMRNDLARVCTDESVVVPQLCGLEAYQNVFHLVSAVRGRLRDGLDATDVLRAVFPGGSITGAPKVRAMQIIQELEPMARGAYCGSIGYLSTTGHADFNILIRTITAAAGWWQIPVGGGIVAGSDPAREYEETWTKASAMLSAVSRAQSAN